MENYILNKARRARTLLVVGALALAFLGTASEAPAAITHYEVTGTVASVQDNSNRFGGSVTIGQTFTAHVFIDPDDPRLTAPPQQTSNSALTFFSWMLSPPGQEGFSVTLGSGLTLQTNTQDPIFFYATSADPQNLFLNGGNASLNQYPFFPPNAQLICSQPAPTGCAFFQVQWLFTGSGITGAGYPVIPNPLQARQINIYYYDDTRAQQGNIRLNISEQWIVGSPDPGGPMVWSNDWDPSKIYHANDVVMRNESVWLALSPNLDSDPAVDNPDWITISGSAGPVGPAGPAGPQGATGATGATGPAGATGATGLQGPIGLTGAIGPAGPTTVGSVVFLPATGGTAPSAPAGYIFRGFVLLSAKANGGGTVTSYAVYVKE